MHSKRSLVGIDQKIIDKLFQSFDLARVPEYVLTSSLQISDKRLLAWLVAQPEVKVLRVGLQPNVTKKQKELIVKDIQSGLVQACIKDSHLAKTFEKFLLKSLTFESLSLSNEQRSYINLELLPKLRAEKGLWGSDSMLEIITRLFVFDLVFEAKYFDEIVSRTLTTAGKLNNEHEAKIAKLNTLMLDRDLALQFGSDEQPFKRTAFLYNRISERVFRDARYLDKPYQAKALKAIYDSDIIDDRLESYEQLAQRYDQLKPKSVENAIGELNIIAKELGIDELISRTNKGLPEENFPFLNPSLYCKTVKQIAKQRKLQQKGAIK